MTPQRPFKLYHLWENLICWKGPFMERNAPFLTLLHCSGRTVPAGSICPDFLRCIRYDRGFPVACLAHLGVFVRVAGWFTPVVKRTARALSGPGPSQPHPPHPDLAGSQTTGLDQEKSQVTFLWNLEYLQCLKIIDIRNTAAANRKCWNSCQISQVGYSFTYLFGKLQLFTGERVYD
jgi:hypothetical protein